MAGKKANENAKATRTRSRVSGVARKAERVKEQDKRHAANVDAGLAPRRQTRKRKADNNITCKRCNMRVIRAGSVCTCRALGVGK